jgi:hypothetical protein
MRSVEDMRKTAAAVVIELGSKLLCNVEVRLSRRRGTWRLYEAVRPDYGNRPNNWRRIHVE